MQAIVTYGGSKLAFKNSAWRQIPCEMLEQIKYKVKICLEDGVLPRLVLYFFLDQKHVSPFKNTHVLKTRFKRAETLIDNKVLFL